MYHREAKSFPWAMSTYGIRVTFGVGAGAMTESPEMVGERRGDATQGHYQVETGEDISRQVEGGAEFREKGESISISG